MNNSGLGVFENNEPAYRCYKAVGFKDVLLEECHYYHVLGEDWKCLELEMESIDYGEVSDGQKMYEYRNHGAKN